MKLWVDSVRPAPNEHEYAWMRSLDMAIFSLTLNERKGCPYEEINVGHIIGTWESIGGVELLEWLEKTRRNYPVQIHATDPVEKTPMEEIVQRNGWDKLMKHTVGFAVDGQVYVDVRACSPAEAVQMANVSFIDVDLGDLECIDFEPFNVYDKDAETSVDYEDWHRCEGVPGVERSFTVWFSVDARAYVTAIARSPEEAVRKAGNDFCCVKLGELMFNWWKVVNVEDEKGKLYDDERVLFGNGGTVDGLISEAVDKCSEMSMSDNSKVIEFEKG